MDTSKPAVFVNADLLRLHVGRKVRALVQVIRSENGAVIGKSTDDSQIIVKGSPPGSLTSFVEVIGIANGDKSINAETWTNFGDAIGMITINPLLFFFYCFFNQAPLTRIICVY